MDKIEGFVEHSSYKKDALGTLRLIVYDKPNEGDKYATVIVHEKEPEKVYTESEVRALFQEIIAEHFVLHQVPVVRLDELKAFAAKYGITL